MNRKNAAYILNVTFISLLLILFLIGCERFNSDDYHDNAIDEHDASMSASTTEESPSNDKPDDIPEQNDNENTDPKHEGVVDYSQMSDEEIISAFMKAWEEQNTEVMDELSNFSTFYADSFDFQKYGYDCIFCWGGSDLAMSLPEYNHVRPVCEHGSENYSHAVYDLEIRQSDNSDYGCAPEELSSHKHYQDVYYVSFNMDNDSIIRHLEVCICGAQEGTLISDGYYELTGKYGLGIYFRMINDKEKGHRVIANKGWVADNLGR